MSITYPHFDFVINHKSQHFRARIGTLITPHGNVDTPNFIFCATKAAIKGGLTPHDMRQANTQFILSNTYHLMLSPGSDVVAQMGGLHKFMGWDGPILTDSGGFQIFSLGHGSIASEIKGKRLSHRPKTVLKIEEEGVVFKSYINGQLHHLTPEKSIQVQRGLGPDFVVMFDECTPFHVDKNYTAESMRRSHRWGERSLQEFTRHHDGTQALYGIIQGGTYEDLRSESCDFVNEQPFFGHAIGGSLGASKQQMYDVVAHAMAQLNPKRPVHLLGIGGIGDIFSGVKNGVDTFDCVHPTRLARHGGALVQPHLQPENSSKEYLNLKNARYKLDSSPIDPDCGCHTCQNFSRGYLHYLIKAGEMLGLHAITIHNVYFMNRLLAAIRQAIVKDNLDIIEQEWIHRAQ